MAHDGALRPSVDARDIGLPAQELDRHHRDQMLDLFWQCAEAVMEQDPPLLPVGWERIHELWYNSVKGRHAHEAFGIYDTVRHDTIWLDKA